MNHSAPKPAQSLRSNALSGVVQVPGDKSISHRTLMLASQAIGVTKITNLLQSEDVLNTMKALQAMGVSISMKDGVVTVEGAGPGGFEAPKNPLDLGNSGTGVRLLMGLVAPYAFDSTFVGDASLSKRPMKRVMTPLSEMGVRFTATNDNLLPLTVHGSAGLAPITYRSPIASAQIKSAVLLAGLNTPGITTVIEPQGSRDHTERMLRYLGATVEEVTLPDGAHQVSVHGQPTLKAKDFLVPADPSSAAFLVVATLLTKTSSVTLQNICLNPYRTGLFSVLKQMGASIEYINQREVQGEVIADLVVKFSELSGVEVPESVAPSMIDEYPILAVAAAFASGKTIMRGLSELRVKESDRLNAIVAGLHACGVQTEVLGDDLTVFGGATITPTTPIVTHMDHRIAMAFLVMGLCSDTPVVVDDTAMIDTSFPEFIPLMQRIGAQIQLQK